MRTTFEIIDAARLGEPCTDMELRSCITAMHGWETMAMNMLLNLVERMDSPHVAVRGLARRQPADHVGYRLKGFAKPVDEYIGPHRVPGSDEVRHRARVAGKVVAAAMKRAEDRKA